MRRARPAVLAALCLAALPALAAAEDLTIVSRVTSPKGGAARTQTQYLSAEKVRTSDADRDTILDLATGRLVLVNDRKREYSETTLDEVRAFMGQLDAAMAGKPVMEKMLGNASEVSVRKGGETRTIAGYETTRYVLSMGDAMRFEIWAAPALAPPVQYFDARKALYATLGPLSRRFDAMFEEMKKIKGFPLATTIDYKMMMVRQQTLTEATEVRKGPIAPSVFEVPAGYRKIASPFAKRG